MSRAGGSGTGRAGGSGTGPDTGGRTSRARGGRRSRWLVGLAAVALVVASAGLAVGVGAAQQDGARVSISNVTVSPEQPAPGQRVTVTTTIQNSPDSSQAVEVTDLFVRRAGGSTDLARVEDLGTVPIGGRMEVPLSLSFDEAGTEDLRVHVVARTESDSTFRLQYPVSVIVRAGGPQVSIDVGDAVVGVDTPVNVTVSNGESEAVRQLELVVEGPDVDVDEPRRIAARLEAGRDRRFAYVGRFDADGERAVDATLSYVTAGGERRTVVERATVGVEPLRTDVAVEAGLADEGSVDPAVSVTVSNFGNAPLSDVSVGLRDGSRTVARRLVGEVPAGSTRTIAVNVTDLDDTTLDVVAAYRVGSSAGEATTTVRYAAHPGRIELTGVDVEREGGLVRISGSASNVGLGEVSSVIVRVLPADGVTPAPPNREYFVGTVPASDFVSFDLTARVDGGVPSVPVEVTYLAGGVERREQVAVPVDAGPTPDEPRGSGGLGLWAAVLGAVVLLAAVGGVVYVGWRNRDGA